MSEMLPGLGLSKEHEGTMDELLPGWRDLTPVEFADRLTKVGDGLADAAEALQRALEDLAEKNEGE